MKPEEVEVGVEYMYRDPEDLDDNGRPRLVKVKVVGKPYKGLFPGVVTHLLGKVTEDTPVPGSGDCGQSCEWLVPVDFEDGHKGDALVKNLSPLPING